MSLKKLLTGSLALILACSMCTGCGNSSNETAAETASAVVTPSGEAIETDYCTVTLMSDYVKLEGTQTKIAEVSDEDIDYEIDSLLDENTSYDKVTRAAEEGDSVELYVTVSVDGEEQDDFTESAYTLIIGDGDYGTEIDEKLVGMKTGDKINFTVKYASDDDEAPFPGSTLKMKGKVGEIDEVTVPELTEEFIQDTLGYDSEEAMRESIKADLESQLTEDAVYECKSDLFQQVIDGSTFEDYNEDAYNSILDSVTESYQSYADMFGMELEDFLEGFYGMTEDDMADEAMNTLYGYAVDAAIAEEQGLEVSDEEYAAGLESYAEYAEYDSTEELESDYGETTLRGWMLEEKVEQFLYEHANITEVEETEEETVEETVEEDTEA